MFLRYCSAGTYTKKNWFWLELQKSIFSWIPPTIYEIEELREASQRSLTSQAVSTKTLLCPTSSFSGGKTKPLHKKV